MKRYAAFILMLGMLSGCDKVCSNPLMGGMGITNPLPLPPRPIPINLPRVYLLMGQSNAAFMGQNDLGVLQQALGAVAVINCAVPSTDMGRWMDGGDLYAACVSQARATIAGTPNAYLAGVMFWQGETDSTWGSYHITLWPYRFGTMVSGLRAIFGAGVPVTFAQVALNPLDPNRPVFRDTQTTVSIAGVKMILTDGIAPVGDHTDTAGYFTMAQRFINSFL